MDNRDTPYVGRNGITLQQAWDPDPVAYFGVAAPDMPNMFIMFGPNSAPFAGSIVHTFEAAAKYIIKCIKKIQFEHIKSMVVK
jgi:cation diffusion facilitator CzcD-associated flavoprotein CzcO